MKKHEPLFADAVHDMTFGSRLRVKDTQSRIGEKQRGVLARLRADLRRAERYVVDDDAVRLVCELSHEHRRLPGWSFLARLPFDPVWFELDLHTKVRKFAEMGTLTHQFEPDQVARRAGYLFTRDDESARWCVHSFFESDDNVYPGLLSYVFDPEGSEINPVRGSKRWHAPTLSLRKDFPRLPAKAQIGDGEIFVETEIDPEVLVGGDLRLNDEGTVVSQSYLENRMAVFANPFWVARADLKIDAARLNKILAIECKEESGHLRWLITLLASINNLPKDVKPIAARVGKRMIGANMLPYFQHNVISIKLPKDNRVVWARKQLQSAVHNMPRAWHRVSGHWRIIERGKTLPYICRHIPVMVENGLGMCEKCQLLIRWITDHTRGDPSVGIVDHRYKVTT